MALEIEVWSWMLDVCGRLCAIRPGGVAQGILFPDPSVERCDPYIRTDPDAWGHTVSSSSASASSLSAGDRSLKQQRIKPQGTIMTCGTGTHI
eukprot:14437225-Heterocapsa_arctica.AAC.1